MKDIAERLNTLSILMKVVSSYRQPGDLSMLPVVSEFTARSLVKNALAHFYWLHECRMANSPLHSCGKASAILVWCKELLSTLLNEDSVVILGNASFHKSAETRELVEQTGAKLLFLPPYSPDINPIEHDFGALKKIREYNHKNPLVRLLGRVSSKLLLS